MSSVVDCSVKSNSNGQWMGESMSTPTRRLASHGRLAGNSGRSKQENTGEYVEKPWLESYKRRFGRTYTELCVIYLREKTRRWFSCSKKEAILLAMRFRRSYSRVERCSDHVQRFALNSRLIRFLPVSVENAPITSKRTRRLQR